MHHVSRSWFALLVVVGLLVTACKKESGNPAGDLQPKPVVVDTSKLSAALLAHVPADSPYVVASFETVPFEIYDKMAAAAGPMMKRAMDTAATFDPEHKPLIDAVFAELDGKWNVKGLESLGLSATPKFVVYGLGVMPVMRIELRDHKALLATIERVAKQAGMTVPPQQQHGNVSFWQYTADGKTLVILALTDNQAVFAITTTDLVASSLDLILGTKKPDASMADGKVLKDAIAKYGFSPHMVGVVDSVRLIDHALALPVDQPPPACGPELRKLAARTPRLVIGTSEVSAQRMSTTMVLELASDLAGEVKGIKNEVPGFTELMGGNPLLALSAAMDVAKGQKLVGAFGEALTRLGSVCEARELSELGDNMVMASKAPLPEPVTKLAGAVLRVDSLSMSHGMPEKIDAIAFASTTGAKALYELATKLEPNIAQLGIQPDGKLHDVSKAAVPVPFAMYAGVSDKVLVAGAGTTKPLAQKLMTASGGGKVPLLAMTYDYGGLMRLSSQAGGRADDDLMRMANLFGRAKMTLDATDNGLAITTIIDLK